MNVQLIRTVAAHAAALLLVSGIAATASGQTIASDFEIQRMKQQAQNATDFLTSIPAHLNLGDLYRIRTDRALARAEYRIALNLAENERADARMRSDVRRYVIGTAYAGLSYAKLDEPANAFTLLEEAMRYEGDTARAWNIYAISMNELGQARKGISAARNAIAVATAQAKKTPTITQLLDLGVYRYTLAGALTDDQQLAEAQTHLQEIVQTLRSPRFDALRRTIAKQEAFEVYFVTSGDVPTYVSLLNRAQLRLGDLYERAGQRERALAVYDAVLADRLDDPDALAGKARLAGSQDRERHYAEAFDANPFALPLVREYQQWLANHTPAVIEPTTPGAKVRSVLVHIARGETRAARAELQALMATYPGNETLTTLLKEFETVPRSAALPGANPTAAELRGLLALFEQNGLTAEQRAALDKASYVSTVTFEPGQAAPAGQTIFETGTINGVRVRFSEPTAFAGSFAAGVPLRLTYRVLGATDIGGAGALLLEPLKLVKP